MCGHLDGQRDKLTNNRVNNIANTVFILVAGNGGVELHGAVLKRHLNVEDRGEHVVLVVFDRDLFRQVSHRRVNTVGDTFDD